jgi:hypothetical protein
VQPRDATEAADRIEEELPRRGNPKRADGARRYLKSTLLFVGVDTAAIRRTVKGILTGAAPVGRFPELRTELDRWACDADFWVRRAALLALLLPLRRGGGDFERFARYADRLPAAAWLAPRTHRLSAVTVREAVRYLPQGQRVALLAAYRERRPASTVRGDWRD